MTDEQQDEPQTPKRATVSKAVRRQAKAKAAVDKFVAEHLRNSPFSLDTPAWNHFQAGLPVLIGHIVSEMED